MNFGENLKEYRLRKRLTLRDCSLALTVDPSNWSKWERGITPAPKDSEVLCQWAAFFELNADEEREFLDLAALSRNQIPDDLASDERLMQKLPAFFRVVRGKELQAEKLEEFIEDLRRIHGPEHAPES